MKDLYKRLGINAASSAPRIREAISAPELSAEAATLAAAEFVLLNKKRRAVYDRTHRVLTTVGDLRAHLGLNYKTFWMRGKLRDFTYELAPAQGSRPRRAFRSIRPADIRRAFGLRGREPVVDYEGARRRLLVVTCVLVAITLVALGILVYFAVVR